MPVARFRVPTEEEIAKGAEIGRLEHRYDAARFTYNGRRDSITFYLVNGVVVEVPRSMLGRLNDVSKSDLRKLRLGPTGSHLEVAGTEIDVGVQGSIRSAVG